MESWPNLVASSDEEDSHAASRVDVRAFSLVLALVRGGYGETMCCLSLFIFDALSVPFTVVTLVEPSSLYAT